MLMTLLKWLTLLLGFLIVTLLVLLFQISFFFLTLVFVLQWFSLHSDQVVSVSIDFPSNSKEDAQFYGIAYDYNCADWDDVCDHLRDNPQKSIFKLGGGGEFCEWVQVGINVCIPHCKYQTKPHSSPWFSTTCITAIACRNHSLCFKPTG